MRKHRDKISARPLSIDPIDCAYQSPAMITAITGAITSPEASTRRPAEEGDTLRGCGSHPEGSSGSHSREESDPPSPLSPSFSEDKPSLNPYEALDNEGKKEMRSNL